MGYSSDRHRGQCIRTREEMVTGQGRTLLTGGVKWHLLRLERRGREGGQGACVLSLGSCFHRKMMMQM
jgi:hypothetical protein